MRHLFALPFLVASLLVASLLLSTAAWATHGGPEAFTVLGFEARESKVFFLRSENGEVYRALYVARLGRGASQPTRATSWDPRPGETADQWERRFEARLTRLRRRLVPLARADDAIATFTVSSQTDGYAALGGERADCTDEACWRERVADAYAARRYREDVALTLDTGARAAVELTSFHRPGVQLLGIYRVPDRPASVALVRHLGVAIEGGYASDAAILIEGAAP